MSIKDQAIGQLSKRPISNKQQVNEYLESIKYYKMELTEFCHQMKFPEPTYTRTDTSEDVCSVHCKLSFANESTKYAPRVYEAEETGTSFKKAQ
jgi:hypothetical protein